MTMLTITSVGLQNAKDFIERYLDDENFRREIESIGPKPNDKDETVRQVVRLASVRGFDFTTEEYEQASEDYIDEQYGARDIYPTCCCHTSPTSSASLPRSYAYGEDL